MKHYGMTLQVKDDPATIESYVEHHQHVWPEVEAGLRSIGIEKMRIWLLGRRLFMHMETVDDFQPGRDFARYEAASRRAAEWQRLMESLQEPVPEAKPGEWWAAMHLVYEL